MDNHRGGDAEYDETYVESTIGWGGIVIGPDGIGPSMPEHEALVAAIPGWVGLPEHLDTAVRIYIEVLERPEEAVRLAAVTAIGDVARRHNRLPDWENAREAVRHALDDPSPRVRAAATLTLGLIDQLRT